MKFFDRVNSYFEFKNNTNHPLVPLLRQYLKENSTVAYDEFACERTVHDVLAMDADLQAYVRQYLETGDADCEEFVCGNDFTMEELLESGEFNPVTGALMVQFYRKNAMEALRVLLSHDLIITPENAQQE